MGETFLFTGTYIIIYNNDTCYFKSLSEYPDKTMRKRLLLAEDQTRSFEKFKKVLTRNKWHVTATTSGEEALDCLKESPHDILIADLNLLEMNGMELISRVQLEVNPRPRIIAITDHEFPEVRRRAFEHKVFEFLPKPLNRKKFVECIYRAMNAESPLESRPDLFLEPDEEPRPPFIGIFIAVSTGGPQTLRKLFFGWDYPKEASIFIVQHGPEWALESIPERFISGFNVPARMADDDLQPEAGKIYIAPGKYHLSLEPKNYRVKLQSSLPENFFRPSADPLFRSAAQAFGPYGIGVVLSGHGPDGSRGAKLLQQQGGTVLVQDPKTAVARFMPQAAIETVPQSQVVPLDEMSEAISGCVQKIKERQETAALESS